MMTNPWRQFVTILLLLISFRVAFGGDVKETTIVPELVLGEPNSDGARSMDALLKLEHGGIVLDPFFRAPGLDFSAVLIQRANDKKPVQVISLPGCSLFPATTAQEFSVGSLDAPRGAIVGSRFWLEVSDPENGRADNPELKPYIASLVRYKSPKQEGVQRQRDDVEAISEPILIGNFCSPVFHIYPLGYLETPERIKMTAGVPVVPELSIHTNADGTTFNIYFVNLSEDSIELFSPFLNNMNGGLNPVEVWVSGVRDGEAFKRDLLGGGMGKRPHKWMSSKVPAGAIVGNRSTGRIPAGEYKAQIIVKDIFFTRDLPLNTANGYFTDFCPASAKTILTTPEVTFSVP